MCFDFILANYLQAKYLAVVRMRDRCTCVDC